MLIKPRKDEVQKWMLQNAKTKNLGLFEALNMWFLGKGDGRAGLPRQARSEEWESPRLRKEKNAYAEFCDRAWGSTQLELAEHYKNVGALVDQIKRKEELLERLLQEAPQPPDDVYFQTRKSGEEDLPEDIVRSRRNRELAEQKAPYYAKLRALKQDIETAVTQMDQVQAHIIETNNFTRMVCERVKYHTEQRRDTYWNAAWRMHPEKDKMPITPEPLKESEAELTYTAPHKTLEDEVINMLARKKRLSHKDTDERLTKSSTIKGVA